MVQKRKMTYNEDMALLEEVTALEGEALLKAIGAELGYVFSTPSWMNPTSCFIRHPELGDMGHQRGTWTTVFEAGTLADVLPDWEHDLNASWRLPLPEGWYIELRRWRKGHSVMICDPSGTERAMLNGDNPAEVVAKTWLIYRRSSVQV